MKIIKTGLLFIIKLSIFLNALMWIGIGIYKIQSENRSYKGCISLLIVMLLLSMTPLALYWMANKLFKFDLSKRKKILQPLKNIFEKNNNIVQQGALEIFQNKDEQWLALIGCLFALIVLGETFLPLGSGVYLVLFIFFIIPIVPFTIILSKKVTDKAPTLILTDDKITYRQWTVEDLPFSEIAGIELDKHYLKIKVHDLSKFKKHSWFNVFENIFTDWDALYIDTRILEYNREDLLDIIKKKQSALQTPIQKFITEKTKFPYIPNQVSIGKRVINIIISLSVLSYAIYGLIYDKLVIPSNTGSFELYGFSIYIMLVAAILLAVYLLSFVLDHYDRRNNEIIYRKIQRYSSRLGLAMLCVALSVGLFQHSRDYVCRNEIIKKVVSAEAGMNAYVVKRYCALHDPINCKSPIYGVAVYSTNHDQAPDIPFNTASFKKCIVKDIYWEGNNLIIEYLVNDTDWNASLQSHPPVSTKLKRILP